MDKAGKVVLGLLGVGAVVAIVAMTRGSEAADWTIYDLNHDGKVNRLDYDIFYTKYNKPVNLQDPISVQCDFNKDGIVDINDFGKLSVAINNPNIPH